MRSGNWFGFHLRENGSFATNARARFFFNYPGEETGDDTLLLWTLCISLSLNRLYPPSAKEGKENTLCTQMQRACPREQVSFISVSASTPAGRFYQIFRHTSLVSYHTSTSRARTGFSNANEFLFLMRIRWVDTIALADNTFRFPSYFKPDLKKKVSVVSHILRRYIFSILRILYVLSRWFNSCLINVLSGI